MKPLRTVWLGRTAYAEAFALQTRLASEVGSGAAPETLLLLEHEPVYTLGRRASDAEVLLDETALHARGISVERTDRGGRVTYHGPGQLVGYPIVDLGAAADVRGYVCNLQDALIDVCASYGVSVACDPDHVGVWAGTAKIGAIGVHVSRGITTHGFALNVSPDLGAFNGIIPCGITDRSVTSLAELGVQPVPSVEEVAHRVSPVLASRLRRALVSAELSEIVTHA